MRTMQDSYTEDLECELWCKLGPLTRSNVGRRLSFVLCCGHRDEIDQQESSHGDGASR